MLKEPTLMIFNRITPPLQTVIRLLCVSSVMGLLLAGCNTANPLVIKRTSCPAVAVVKHAGTLSRFGGNGSFDAGNLQLSATLSALGSDCTDKNGARSVISFEVSARGAAAGDVELPYFVAVVKDGTTLLSKQIYTAKLRTNEAGNRGHTHVNVTITTPAVPLPPKPKPSDFDEFAPPPKQLGYEVLIGFQLSDAEVAYNISH